MTFDQRINLAIKECVSKVNYKPTAFLKMIDDYGTIMAVKKLINSTKVSDGYIKLYEKQRLDLTVEAIILEDKWNDLFTEKELLIAQNRLKQYGYSIPPKSKNWTKEELKAAVEAYKEMLILQKRKIAFNKSSFNEKLRNSSLKDRTRGSIEFRMQNISSVFQAIGLPIVDGYLPAKNIGINKMNEVIEIIEDLNLFDNEILDLDFSINFSPEIYRKEKIAKPKGTLKPKSKKQEISVFKRNPLVKIYVLQRSNGKCELCNNTPFLNKYDQPFLEVHHILPLSENGADTVLNAVALCPNCHRELHYGKNTEEKNNQLIEKINS